MHYGDHAKNILALANGLDDSEQERDATNEFRRRWAREGLLVCAVCGFDKAQRFVEVAHRRALEEYGYTVPANLVPLCRSSVDDARRSGENLLSRLLDMYAGREISIAKAANEQAMRLGCHDLLDNGLIPKSELERGAREQALELPLQALEGDFGIRGKRERIAKAKKNLGLSRYRQVRQILRDACDRPSCLKKISSLISLLRRCSDAEARRALRLCREVQEELVTSPVVGKPLSLFLYEYALALQVAEPQERLNQTQQRLAQSCAAVEERSGSWGMSHLELVHAEFLASTLDEVVKRRDEWLRRQDNALDVLTADADLPPNHKGRWRMNYLMHRAKLLAKAALCGAITPDELSRALEAAWTFRNKCTIVNGWARFQSVHLVTLEGIALHVKGCHEEAITCVARGLRPMTKGRGKRPEGMKDIAYCMARCFDSLGLTVKRDKANEEGNALFDQRSGIVLSVV